MRHFGRRLGVDVGTVRVGVSISDPDGILATPLRTLDRSSSADPTPGDPDVAEVISLAREHDVAGIVVGLPRSLSGDEGQSAQRAREYANVLAVALNPVPVRLVDERLSTVGAQRGLAAAGRTTRDSRAVIDQAAAVVILQTGLDTERNTGVPAGELVGVTGQRPRKARHRKAAQ